uniref:Uncharacterized protein n=1 Tax=Anguilla anguilla TaxID=7936 RepID=A0A0E9S4Z8_ANGAN
MNSQNILVFLNTPEDLTTVTVELFQTESPIPFAVDNESGTNIYIH